MSDKKQDTNSAWGGRFSEQTDAFVEAFTASVQFDQRMYKQDIAGSRAHAKMLNKIKVLSEDDLTAILNGLDKVEQEIGAGEFDWSVAREDVHMNIEARLTELIGDAGKRLHTGRSRNDQVATDIRLYLREQTEFIINEMTRLQQGIVLVAEREAETIMPGFTHLQVAQPVTFGHHLMAWYEMLKGSWQLKMAVIDMQLLMIYVDEAKRDELRAMYVQAFLFLLDGGNSGRRVYVYKAMAKWDDIQSECLSNFIKFLSQIIKAIYSHGKFWKNMKSLEW